MAVATAGYLLLDAVAGWRGVPDGLAATGPDGALAPEPLPGVASPLLPMTGSTGCGPSCPSALAVERCGRLLVADSARHRIERVDPARGTSEPIAAVGGPGDAVRRFREPKGVAVTRAGGIAVADTGNHRLQVFTRPPYAVRFVRGAIDGLGRPAPGDGPGEFRWPWAVAVGPCGSIHVVDRGNHRVQVFAPNGRWLRAFGSDILADPTRLAIGPDGIVAIVDGLVGTPGRTSALYLFPPGGEGPHLCEIDVPNPRSVVFGGGRFYVGDAVGLIHVFDPAPTAPCGYSKIGEGVTGLAAAIVDLVWDATVGLAAIVRGDDGTISLQKVDPAGGCVTQGTLATSRLDSGIDHCHWHRVAFTASLPTGAGLTAEAVVSNDPTFDPTTLPDTSWNLWNLTGDDPDLLLPSGDAGTGQYLWLRLTLRSDGEHLPTLTRVKVYYPRNSYLQYLPAVYQEDDESRMFLERFLSIFQTDFDGFDSLLDTLWMRMLDPASADAKFLPWLAAWLALTTDPTWDDATLRAMIKGAFAYYQKRGTVAGLEQAVSSYGGVAWGKVVEHYRLRRLTMLSAGVPLDGTARLWSADIFRRLRVGRYSEVGRFRLADTPEPAVEPLYWGANRFSVFFPANPVSMDATKARVAAVVEREKPAHTLATLCPVFPRLRVGVQATLGVDSVVGGISPLLLNRLATLGYDTVLSPSDAERQLSRLGATPRPRVGVSLKLS
jgi:phage tail-like protein